MSQSHTDPGPGVLAALMCHNSLNCRYGLTPAGSQGDTGAMSHRRDVTQEQCDISKESANSSSSNREKHFLLEFSSSVNLQLNIGSSCVPNSLGHGCFLVPVHLLQTFVLLLHLLS